MNTVSDARIRDIAYHLWEMEGGVHGRDQFHWFAARKLLDPSDPASDEDDVKSLRKFLKASLIGISPDVAAQEPVSRPALPAEPPPVAPPEPVVPPIPPIELSGRYRFSIDEKRVWMHDVSGLGRPETKGRWTIGPKSTFTVFLPEDCAQPLLLVLGLRSLMGAAMPTVMADLVINGVHIGMIDDDLKAPKGVHQVSFKVPGEAVGPHKALTVEIHVHDPRSPLELGMNSDDRELGFSLISFELVQQPSP